MPLRQPPRESKPRWCWWCGGRRHGHFGIVHVRHLETGERQRVALCASCRDNDNATIRFSFEVTVPGPGDAPW